MNMDSISKRAWLATAIFVLFAAQLSAQNYCKVAGQKVTIDNGLIQRVITLENGRLNTVSLLLNNNESFSVPHKSKEFSFFVNDKEYNGFSGWELVETKPFSDETGGEGIAIVLRENVPAPKIEVELNYLVYPGLPLIRKWLKVKNRGNEEVKLESVNVEDFVSTMIFYWSVVHHNYARQQEFAHYVGNADDPVVVVHNTEKRMGIALGNEAMGVIKRTAFNTATIKDERSNIEVGLTHTDQDYPFRKWIQPGASFETPKTFICLYENRDDAFEVVNEEVNEFVIKHMQPRIVKIKEKPTFVYNTWIPFNTNFNDTVIHEVATVAAECGIQEFVVDVGWHVNDGGESAYDFIGPDTYGDWLVDENKFKGGLKPTFDYMKSLGMKPGLWMSVGSASVSSKVFKEHPEWFAKDKDGNFTYLQNIDSEGVSFSASFGTDWKDYIKGKILGLVDSYGLSYIKLDFAVVTSAYVTDVSHSGDYGTDRPYFKDHPESFGVLYSRLLQLFDELHQAAPDLFIDCTYETAGRHHLMDYAIANHAEGNWISNFNEPSPTGPLRIRHLAWWRSPAVPASSLVIGNFELDDPEYEFGLKSLIGTLPIVLGDLRNLSKEKIANIKQWADWMKEMQEKYDYMSYRKDLQGFGEPQQGSWDGWQRINFQTKQGGIVGVFKQGALENSRQVFVKDLEHDANYEVLLAPMGKVVHTASGKSLMQDGFSVSIEKEYDGKIVEIRKIM
jgi:alpha-galactosidase